MYLIKVCPSCKNKIRFPVDKGKIQVKCACGYSFIADPDEPLLYKNSRFDLNYKRVKRGTRDKAGIFSPGTVSKFINKVINFKYKLQNFRLLPFAEQYKIITIIGIIVIILFIISIMYLFRT